MLSTLIKIFCLQFYRDNASFFLMLVYVCFGMMNAFDALQFHNFLLQGITSSITSICITAILYIAYSIKVISHNTYLLKCNEYAFLKETRLVSTSKQITAYTAIHFYNFLPPIIYLTIAIFKGILLNRWIEALFLIFFIMLVGTLHSIIFYNVINRSKKADIIQLGKYSILNNKLNHTVGLYFLWTTKKSKLLFIKAISLLIYQFLVLLNYEHVSKENFSFITQLAIAINGLLPYYLFTFFEEEYYFSRLLPIKLVSRYGNLVFTYSILMLPELLFMLFNNQGNINIVTIVAFYSLAVFQLFLYHALQYSPYVSINNYSLLLFFSFFTGMLLTAFLPVALLLVIIFLSGILLFKYYYSKFEL